MQQYTSDGSRKLFTELQKYLVDGVSSSFHKAEIEEYPIGATHGKGSKVYDVDGNEYIDYVLSRITVVGAAYLTFICIVPEYLVSALSIPFYLGGTSLLIVVNVTMDTVTQIQSHLLAHQYGDLIKKAKLKGARRR